MASPENRELVREAYARLKSARAVARELDLPRSTVRRYIKGFEVEKPVSGGSESGRKHSTRPVPKQGVARYICTSAQNNTDVHGGVWDNLLALAEHYGAEILVSRFAYNKHAYSQPEKPGAMQDTADLWYDARILPHINDERVELAPGLMWCGEMNILPTAVRPLSGLDNYTGRRSGVFPHVKCSMMSVPSGKEENTKLNFTTGTVTLRNYIQKKAGLKAEFHHVYGALLVEVDTEGRWFCRQLNADSDSVIHDLAIRAVDGRIEESTVEAINWGDVHAAQVDTAVAEMAWGAGGMIDTLRPRHQFMHDLVDFRARNHHDVGNPHAMFQRFVSGAESVREELQEVVALIERADRDYCKMVVIDSNHDNAMTRWLRESDYRRDPMNALFFLEAQLRFYRAIEEDDKEFHAIEWALQTLGCPESVEFLRQDESFVLLRERGGGIECGMHGHLGPNGSRGTPRGLSRMGRRANTGHTHTSEIVDGLYVAGTSSQLDMGYNKGPSSWTHSHIVTYPNGKRAIVTMFGGAWKASP